MYMEEGVVGLGHNTFYTTTLELAITFKLYERQVDTFSCTRFQRLGTSTTCSH